jgi:calcium/calmodulin-dependent protein kinase I
LINPDPTTRLTAEEALKHEVGYIHFSSHLHLVIQTNLHSQWLTSKLPPDTSTAPDLTGLRENFNPKARWQSAIKGAIALNRLRNTSQNQNARVQGLGTAVNVGELKGLSRAGTGAGSDLSGDETESESSGWRTPVGVPTGSIGIAVGLGLGHELKGKEVQTQTQDGKLMPGGSGSAKSVRSVRSLKSKEGSREGDGDGDDEDEDEGGMNVNVRVHPPGDSEDSGSGSGSGAASSYGDAKEAGPEAEVVGEAEDKNANTDSGPQRAETTSHPHPDHTLKREDERAHAAVHQVSEGQFVASSQEPPSGPTAASTAASASVTSSKDVSPHGSKPHTPTPQSSIDANTAGSSSTSSSARRPPSSHRMSIDLKHVKDKVKEKVKKPFGHHARCESSEEELRMPGGFGNVKERGKVREGVCGGGGDVSGSGGGANASAGADRRSRPEDLLMTLLKRFKLR